MFIQFNYFQMSIKKSELRRKATIIMSKIFESVTKSKDKADWLRAIDCINKHIHKLKTNSNHDPELIWTWEAVKYDMVNRYGKKFIKPGLK